MASYKYVCVDSHKIPLEYFRVETQRYDEVGIRYALEKCATQEEAFACAADADAIGMINIPFDRALMSRFKNCKLIVRYGIGVDSVDLQAASDLGIKVCNLPTYCIEEVAAHSVAMVLDIIRKLTLHDRRFRTGLWNGGYGYPSRRLSKLTVGLVGFGKIARCTAGMLKPMFGEVIAYDLFLGDDAFAGTGVRRAAFGELLEQADVVSLHVPLTPDTHHLIRAETIEKMKDGAFLVNVSRGEVVSINDLVAALKSGKLSAAGLDVVEGEPIRDAEHPMFTLENLVATPHAAYNSLESMTSQHEEVADTVIRVLSGEWTPNIVNAQMLKQAANKAPTPI